MEMMQKHVLDVEDIQEVLGIGKRQAYELVHSGVFPIKRIGARRIKIPTQAFIDWLNTSD